MLLPLSLFVAGYWLSVAWLVDTVTKFATTSTITNSVDSSFAFDSSTDYFPGSAWGANFLSIIAIKLNERNYSPWTKSVKVYLLAKGQASM